MSTAEFGCGSRKRGSSAPKTCSCSVPHGTCASANATRSTSGHCCAGRSSTLRAASTWPAAATLQSDSTTLRHSHARFGVPCGKRPAARPSSGAAKRGARANVISSGGADEAWPMSSSCAPMFFSQAFPDANVATGYGWPPVAAPHHCMRNWNAPALGNATPCWSKAWAIVSGDTEGAAVANAAASTCGSHVAFELSPPRPRSVHAIIDTSRAQPAASSAGSWDKTSTSDSLVDPRP
mmetsp:Transcript_8732/g.35649  ORF Transcript_8732/g.35649 Transcript_8732/m.35649 type:complete len:237 (-) Transcript_8732:438-1148(-)